MVTDPERNNPLDTDPPRNKLLAQIKQGMTVLDADGDTVGTVDFVKMADLNDPDGTRGRREDGVGFPDVILDTNDDDDDLLDALGVTEDDVTERMRRSGYVKIDTAGLFADDTYVVPRQIASVDEHVHLNERKENIRQPS